MKELVILMGIGNCGKTTFAKTLINHKHISLDKHFQYNKGLGAWHKFLDFFVRCLNENPDKDFVLDGWINACTDTSTKTRIPTGHGFSWLEEKLQHHKVKPVVVVLDKETLVKRGSKESEERIAWLYSWWLTMQCDGTAVLGEGNSPVFSKAREEIMGHILCRTEPISPVKVGGKIILKKLARRKENFKEHGDPYYQTIEIGEGVVVPGYNSNYEHKTWAIIKDHLDIKGKDFGEIGCHHGFYLLNIKSLGANKVRGFDMNPLTVESANQIAHFRELDVNYTTLNIESKNLREEFDTLLVMNVFHHLKDPVSALRKVFSHSRKTVLFESQLDINMITEVGKEQGFVLRKQLKSVRPNRTIWIFEK